MNLTDSEWDFYSDNKSEILKTILKGIDKEHRPESEDDLINWYGEQIEELTKEWYSDHLDILNTEKTLNASK